MIDNAMIKERKRTAPINLTTFAVEINVDAGNGDEIDSYGRNDLTGVMLKLIILDLMTKRQYIHQNQLMMTFTDILHFKLVALAILLKLQADSASAS